MAPRKNIKRSKSSPAWYNKKYSVGDVAAAAWKGVKVLQKLVNSEENRFDVNVSGASVANTAVITQLNNIPAAVTQGSRIGNSILMTAVRESEYKLTSGNVQIREITFIDKQQIADTAPTVLDILETQTPNAFLAVNAKERFTILEDKLYVMNTVSLVNRNLRKVRQLNKHAIYNGPASSDIQKNGLYKLFLADGVVTYNHKYRLTYHDN